MLLKVVVNNYTVNSDAPAPVITMSSDINTTVWNWRELGKEVITYDCPEATDNCEIETLELIQWPCSGALFPLVQTIST